VETSVGVLLQGFFFGPGKIAGVPSPLDGDAKIPFWWDHLASQAQQLAKAGFTAIWLPPSLKGASGSFSSGYDLFDDYDLGAKNQKGTVPTRYGTREQLQRCAAMMRANGIDVYVDLVENQRDGDDGHFNFNYVDAFGKPKGGRFAKGPGDFHPHVPEDAGVFSDQFQFGRDLAPINGIPKNHCSDGLLNAADWLTRALDLQGYRLDNTKGVSTIFVQRLLNHGAMAGKFFVGEFADGNIQLIENWADAVGHRSASFDFPLHFALKNMCNSPDSFDMSTLDHAGLAGVDPLGAVTFVENHDSDRGGIGGPVVRNKLLAYAYILTSEGYPCIFYRDYSKDANCFGLKDAIDPLIAIHENLASGPTQQRWKDGGVFAYERMGGGHLLVALNKDAGFSRNITVQTGFPSNTQLKDFSGHAGTVTTRVDSSANLTVPRNNNGDGFVCYAQPTQLKPFSPVRRATTQVYEGAPDLDIRPATEGQAVTVCRIFCDTDIQLEARLNFDATAWTPQTAIELEIQTPDAKQLLSHKYGKSESGTPVGGKTTSKGLYTVIVQSSNMPPQQSAPAYKLAVSYQAPLGL
jgi:alpha-amylase